MTIFILRFLHWSGNKVPLPPDRKRSSVWFCRSIIQHLILAGHNSPTRLLICSETWPYVSLRLCSCFTCFESSKVWAYTFFVFYSLFLTPGHHFHWWLFFRSTDSNWDNPTRKTVRKRTRLNPIIFWRPGGLISHPLLPHPKNHITSEVVVIPIVGMPWLFCANSIW